MFSKYFKKLFLIKLSYLIENFKKQKKNVIFQNVTLRINFILNIMSYTFSHILLRIVFIQLGSKLLKLKRLFIINYIDQKIKRYFNYQLSHIHTKKKLYERMPAPPYFGEIVIRNFHKTLHRSFSQYKIWFICLKLFV